jgi:hypothetical protein
VQQGDNSIVVTAVDAAGNEASLTRQVHVVTGPPELAIAEPPASFVATTSTVAVRGTASGGAGTLSVTVNGASVSLGSDGSFSTTIEASPGQVTIAVVVTDGLGGQTTKTLAGWRTPDAVAPVRRAYDRGGAENGREISTSIIPCLSRTGPFHGLILMRRSIHPARASSVRSCSGAARGAANGLRPFGLWTPLKAMPRGVSFHHV